MNPDIPQVLKANRVCVVIPTYNNAGTIADVLRRTTAYCHDIIVVDDGCTDNTLQQIAPLSAPPGGKTPLSTGEPSRLPSPKGETGRGLHIVSYTPNRGKGAALVAGFQRALSLGFDYALTLDSDGQHFPEDIPLFVEALQQHPQALIVGSRNLRQENMPGGNTFANKFSNFWFTVETWQRLPDTQTGYRLYPLRRMPLSWPITSRYEAELELLVYAAWSCIELFPVPVRVYYPPQGERISHFRPTADFVRISILNTVLCFLAVVYAWPRMLLRRLRRQLS